MGGDESRYRGLPFRTAREARWAVFFETHGEGWQYEPDGWPGASTAHYRPQLYLPYYGIYLDVRDRFDHRTSSPELYRHPEAPEPCIFLAAGDIPTDQQMRAIGWWDPQARRGVLQLTAGFEWELLFPATSSDVLAALEAARNETFDLTPWPRRDEHVIRDVHAERDREPGQ